jgi:hypothetical protein
MTAHNKTLIELVTQLREEFTIIELEEGFTKRTMDHRFYEIGQESATTVKEDHVLIFDGYDIAVSNRYSERDIPLPGTEGRKSNWK